MTGVCIFLPLVLAVLSDEGVVLSEPVPTTTSSPFSLVFKSLKSASLATSPLESDFTSTLSISVPVFASAFAFFTSVSDTTSTDGLSIEDARFEDTTVRESDASELSMGTESDSVREAWATGTNDSGCVGSISFTAVSDLVSDSVLTSDWLV